MTTSFRCSEVSVRAVPSLLECRKLWPAAGMVHAWVFSTTSMQLVSCLSTCQYLSLCHTFHCTNTCTAGSDEGLAVLQALESAKAAQQKAELLKDHGELGCLFNQDASNLQRRRIMLSVVCVWLSIA